MKYLVCIIALVVATFATNVEAGVCTCQKQVTLTTVTPASTITAVQVAIAPVTVTPRVTLFQRLRASIGAARATNKALHVQRIRVPRVQVNKLSGI